MSHFPEHDRSERVFSKNEEKQVSNDQRHVPNGGRKSAQTLNTIRPGRMDDEKQEPKPKQPAAVVADPKNRLAEGKIDPVTKELKPDKK